MGEYPTASFLSMVDAICELRRKSTRYRDDAEILGG